MVILRKRWKITSLKMQLQIINMENNNSHSGSLSAQKLHFARNKKLSCSSYAPSRRLISELIFFMTINGRPGE